ncbi:MAG: hypothetical protein LAT55_07740 [Opitutales bacterium]|nr:hypothetical protein [Opitutales bacterium]
MNLPLPLSLPSKALCFFTLWVFLTLATSHADDDVWVEVTLERPFMLWTESEAEAIRERLQDPDPNTERQLAHTLALANEGDFRNILLNLFRAFVLEEDAIRQSERQRLIETIGRRPEPLTWDVDPSTLQWNVGMPSAGDRHMRDERTEDALRYDMFYRSLSPRQHQGIRSYFKSYIQFHLDGHPPRHPEFSYSRTGWLPNMHWPRPIGTHLQAVALGDEELIRQMFHAEGGWKWYFDEYLADQGFYMEEFGKFYSNTGSMIFWCEALERMGLSEMGYDYVGKTGITMHSHLRANTLDITYPATDWGPDSQATYAQITMGDAKRGPFRNRVPPIQHTLITGYLPDGNGGNRRAVQPRMNGPMAKMLVPFWLEAAHHRWPDEGYDFFLAALRAPGEDTFFPTLFFNLSPLEAATVQPPTPTPSYLAKQRGFAFLRSDHTPTYWEGQKPAVALQFSRYYVHYVHDAMSLLGYHAFNAPLILNSWGTGGGYAGGNAWRDSVRGHSGVVVDNQQARPVARGEDGTEGHRYRENLENALDIRFAAVRADGTYEGVAQERALFLAAEYLLDFTWLQNEDPETPRRYEWQALSPLTGEPGEEWSPSTDLDGLALYEGSRFEDRVRSAPPAPSQVQSYKAGKSDWQLRLAYHAKGETMTDDPAAYGLARRGVGMNLRMLGDKDGTTVYLGVPPGAPKEAPPSLVLARRDTSETLFTALYEPFQKETRRVTDWEQLARNEHAIAVHIQGFDKEDRPFSDIVLYAFGDATEETIHLEGENGFHATFQDHAIRRFQPDQDPVTTGSLDNLTLPESFPQHP